MYPSKLSPLSFSLLGLGLTSFVEAVKYGNNHVPVRKDSELVAANFQDPNVTLLAPAFQKPDSVPATFANGSTGPTDQFELGQYEQVDQDDSR